MNELGTKKFSNRDMNEVQNSTARANRIKEIRNFFCDKNNTKFASKLGVSKQYSSGLCTAGERISEKTLEKILEIFPEVSRSWLYFGEGEMLRADNSSQSSSMERNSGIIVQHGDHSTYNNNSDMLSVVHAQQETITKQADTIASLTETNRQLTEHIGKLIGMLKNDNNF